MFSRRTIVRGLLSSAGLFVTGGCGPSGIARPPRLALRQLSGEAIDLTVAMTRLRIAGEAATTTTLGGGIPGPEIRLREGQEAVIRVHNRLDETTSVHWHGLLVPAGMDGVPRLSYDGIAAGQTFEYRFPVIQAGTYWYHSHSGFQEQTGLYGPLVIEPRERTVPYDREYTIILSDWTFEDPHSVLSKLKSYGGYYNYQRRTLANLGDDPGGAWAGLGDRFRWAGMRMDSTDISDVTGVTYTYLMNGLAPDENWRGLFRPGERVRLRFINAAAATFFDVRIPGLPMTVIQSDGMDVAPVEVDEFRIAIAETYDVIVQPNAGSYTVFAEAMDRSGFTRGTLTSIPGGRAEVPGRRPRPLLTMADMGMDMSGMDMGGMTMGGMTMGGMTMGGMTMGAHAGMNMGGDSGGSAVMGADESPACSQEALRVEAHHSNDGHGAGNSMVAQVAVTKIEDPGVGLRDAPWRVLTYSDLRRREAGPTPLPVGREIELHLTGNMERYMWSFDGNQYDVDMPDILIRRGERVRFVLINDTMMAHPIHLHGTFFELEVGACERNPLKHTVNVKPAERVSFIVEAQEVGRWAFHCHILYHMDTGMFRVVRVTP